MASIVDSVKLVYTDKNAFIKLAIVSLIPFYIYSSQKGVGLSLSRNLDFYLNIILSIYYLGYMFGVLNNSIKEKDYVLPGIGLVSLLFRGIKPIISCGIFLYPAWFFHFQILPKIDTEYFGGKVLMFIGYLIAISFFFSSIILYASKERVIDGFNILKILKIFHEVIVYIFYSVILLILFNVLTSAPLLTAIYGLFGFGRVFDFFVCFLVTSNLAIYFQNLSHLYFEVIRD